MVEPDRPLVTEVYADGGVVGMNPSAVAGTWAWCHVGIDPARSPDPWFMRGDSGFTLARDMPGGVVTNNAMEFLACLEGLEHLPAHWSGSVFLDSLVTIKRFRDGAATRGIPAEWVHRRDLLLSRLGEITWVRVKGHPTHEEAVAGVDRHGIPTSHWNVWCDRECGRRKATAMLVARSDRFK